LPWLVAVGVSIYLSYDAVLAQARANWTQNKCNPIYLPFAGVIMPQPGQSKLRTTVDNFDYCIRRDLSEVFKVILLPLEFVAFSILSMVDLLIESMLLMVDILNRLRSLIGGISEGIYTKLMSIVVPIILFIAKVRDTFAKANAVMLASVYTTLTVYNIIVSGLLSVTTIIVDLLIAMAIVIAGMFVLALILMNPFTFPIGIALFVAANIALNAIFIPTIIIYAIIQVAMVSIFGKQAAKAPSTPKPGKKKKKK